MHSRLDILLDFSNMMAEEVGPHGVQRSEIEALRPEIEEIHRGLEDLRRLGQLPFRELPYHDEMASRIVTRARDLRERFENILLLGIGGSSLGACFLLQALAPIHSRQVIICDHLDSEEWMKISETLDFKKTLVIVVSKSGKTLETLAAFLFFKNCLKSRVREGYRRHLFIITDPTEGPLRKIARQESIESFEIPPGVGGRFSALTAAALFPAALCDIPIEELLAGSRRMNERCKDKDPWHNPAIMSALLHFILDRQRNHAVRVLTTYGLRLRGYASWFAQLWAESLGKKNSLKGREVFAGTTPVCASGPQDQHSQLQLYLEGPRDKAVTFLSVKKENINVMLPPDDWVVPEMPILKNRSVHDLLQAEKRATEEALREAGRPNQGIILDVLNPYTVGQLLYLAEIETVFAGQLYNVNPFDQPAVESIKRHVKDYLNEP